MKTLVAGSLWFYAITLTLGCDRLAAFIEATRDETPAGSSAQAKPEPTSASSVKPDGSATPPTAAAEASVAAPEASAAPSASEAAKEVAPIGVCATAIGAVQASPIQSACKALLGSAASERCSAKSTCRGMLQSIQAACSKNASDARCAQYQNVIDARCDLRQVDWLNQSYPLKLFTLEAAGRAEPAGNILVVRGRAQSADADIRINSFEFGDLDADGGPEVYVKYTVTPRSQTVLLPSTSLAVFEGNSKCEVRLLDTVRKFTGATSKVVGNVVFGVENRKLVGTWDGLDKAGNPVAVRSIWGLRNDRLKQTSERETAAPGSVAQPAKETSKPEKAEPTPGEATPEQPRKRRLSRAKDAKTED